MHQGTTIPTDTFTQLHKVYIMQQVCYISFTLFDYFAIM